MISLLHIAVGLVGWIGAVFVAPMLGMTFWHKITKGCWHWTAHIVLGPFAIVSAWCFMRLIFWAANDDGSGPPGLGLFLILPFVMLIGSITIYYGCLAIQLGLSVWRRLNVR